jgi:hypothetical protein
VLSLSDPRWSELQSTYGSGTRVVDLLSRAEGGAPFDSWYHDLFQELCHQYTVSEAAYAAVPHLVNLARDDGEARKHLLVLAGSCYAFSQLPEASPIPADLEAEWDAAAREAIPLLTEVLATDELSESDLRYLFLSLVAFQGHHSLALALEALDAESECPNCGTIFERPSPMA